MKGKIAFIAGAAVGYVAGTRDGRGRYEQIKAKAQEVWTDPSVREKVDQAASVAGDAASQATAAASDAAGRATAKVRKSSGSGDSETPGTPAAANATTIGSNG